MMKRTPLYAPILLGVGLMFVLVARRVAVEGMAHDVLLWLGVALVAADTLQRALYRGRAHAAAQPVETALLIASAGVLLSLGLYGLTTETGLGLLGVEPTDQEQRLGPMLAVLWPALLGVSTAALAFMELAYRRMPVAEAVEIRRIKSAASDGIAIALSLVFVFSMVFVANQRDERKDFTYFKTSLPSETTLRMVRSVDEPVRAVVFFPSVSEVKDQVVPYFQAIDDATDNFTFEVTDHALAPEVTRKHRVRGNGWVALLRGEGDAEQGETFEIGSELETARSRLRTLDGRFQRTFAKLALQQREIHLTTGHDEHSQSGIEGDSPAERTSDLMDALSRSNITTQPLGMAQGLANEVPANAPAVMVVGPRKPFLPEEADALLRYVKGGGRLIVMVDPEVDTGLTPLLHGLGVELAPGVLTSDRDFLRRTNTLADRSTVRSNHYSSHPTVTLPMRNAAQLATVFIRGGALNRYEGAGATAGITVDFPLKAGDGFWLDTDGDSARGPGEAVSQFNMMAAVSVPHEGAGEGEEGRAVVIADGDFVNDQVIRNPGNVLVLGDVIQWLIGQEQIVGDVASEEDIRIEHTPEEDRLWFWGTSFGVPIPFFAFAIFVNHRRNQRRTPRRPDAPEPKAEAKKKKDEEEGEADADADAETDEDAASAKREPRAEGARRGARTDDAEGDVGEAREHEAKPRATDGEPQVPRKAESSDSDADAAASVEPETTK